MNSRTRHWLICLLALLALLLAFAGYLQPGFMVGVGGQLLLMCGW